MAIGIVLTALSHAAFAESIPSNQTLADVALRHAATGGSALTLPGVAASLEKEVSQDLPNGDSVDLYAGLPGAPALGPNVDTPWFLDVDELSAQSSQGWLDQGYFAYGVVTAGFSHDDQQVELSRFAGNGQDRLLYGLQGRLPYALSLDSTSLRYTWDMDSNWTVEASWGSLLSPEDFAAGMNEERWTASVQYDAPVGHGAALSAMIAWGLKQESNGENLHAAAFDAELHLSDAWSLFAHSNFEQDNRLFADGTLIPGEMGNTGTLSLGTTHSWNLLEHARVAAGGLYTFDMLRRPAGELLAGPRSGAIAYVRLSVQ